MPETEVILFAKNAQQLIGLELKMILRIARKTRQGNPCVPRGPDLLHALDSLIAVGQDKAIVDSIMANGNEIGIRIVCGTQSMIIRFHLALGAAFQIVPSSAVEKYPFASIMIGKRCIQRTHLVFQSKVDFVWILLDCTSFKNMAQWKIIPNTDWHKDLWIGGPDPINYFQAWADNTLAYMKVNWNKIRAYSIARFLTIKELWNGLGAYNLSEVCHRLWKHLGIVPWHRLDSYTTPVGAKELPEFVIQLAVTFRMLHQQSTQYWHAYDLSKHLHELITDFALHHLKVYRKPHMLYYSFRGHRTKEHIYLHHKLVAKLNEDIAAAKKDEQWSLGKSPKVWKFNDLGVGPLAWHSKIDFQILNNPGKYNPFLEGLELIQFEEEDELILVEPSDSQLDNSAERNNDNNQTSSQSANSTAQSESTENRVTPPEGEGEKKKKKYKSPSSKRHSAGRPNKRKRYEMHYQENHQQQVQQLQSQSTEIEKPFANTSDCPKALSTTVQLEQYYFGPQ